MNDETLLEFPTAFPIKALGREHPDFLNTVVNVVAEHATVDAENDVKLQNSTKGNFVSVTVTFTAESQQQLDTIYQSLHDHDMVLMVF